MSAIRLARAFTGRNFIIKFEGCYHGHADGLLVKAGSGVATFGIPGSAGVPEEIAIHTLALPYNDLAAVEAPSPRTQTRSPASSSSRSSATWAASRPHPAISRVCARSLRPRRAAHLRRGHDRLPRRARRRAGALRNPPDLTTLGKIIGGGLPCGAFGGRADVMDQLAPLGPVYQAGTLSGNPLAMAAGIATVGELARRQSEIYPQLERVSAGVANGVAAEAEAAGIPVVTNRVGSMFTWFFTKSPVTDWDTAATSDTALFGKFHRAMLEAGVWLPPSQFEAAFVSTAHGPAEVGLLLEAARQALS